MRVKLAVLLSACALIALGACTKTNDVADTGPSTAPSIGPDQFSVTGTLVDAKAGVTAPVIASPSPSPTPTPTGTPNPDVGGLAVRPTTDSDTVNLDDCTKDRDTFIAYYDENTTFDPSDVQDEATFPENIQGRTVTVTGSLDKNGSTCVLTAENVTVTEPGSNGTNNNGSSGNNDGSTVGSASPGASGSPMVTEGATPPGNHGTDPIFEGTASPDPCEGQKACEQHRETGQQPQP
jgi:hypothetical protein